jgi:hypothetical protein
MNWFFDKISLAAMAVTVETAPTFKPGKPRVLFRGTYIHTTISGLTDWDIHPDGKRFFMMKEAESTGMPADEAPRKINIILNCFYELKQRVP